MAYRQKRFRLRGGQVVIQYHTARYGAPGQKRSKKSKPTPESMAATNRRRKARICQMKLLEHFTEGDYFTTLTYAKELRPPDMETASKQVGKALAFLRKEYRRRGHELKWIRNIECGTKGAWHIHLVLNRIPETDLLVQRAWKQFGKVVNKPMYEEGGFRQLADYITKTPETDPRLKESKYSASRNLPVPEPKEAVIGFKTFGKIRVPKGYYLDADSVYQGTNSTTGYPYRVYTLLKLPEKEKPGGRKK